MKEITELIKAGENEKLKAQLNSNPSLAEGTTEQGISFLQFAAYCNNNNAIDIIRKHKNNLDIYEAASIGDRTILFQLLNKNPELINSFSSDGFTILGLASYFGHKDLVKQLLDKGADPNIPANNQFRVTPLHSACAISNIEIARLLIENGADIHARQMHGVTPLHSAAHNGQTKLAKLLIERGAEINAKMDTGESPVSLAEEKGFDETVLLLREYGA